MSETRAEYLVSGLPRSPRQATLLRQVDPEYDPPTCEDLRIVMRTAQLTGPAVAARTGVSPRTVRKWTSAPDTANYVPIPYAAWRLLLLEVKLVTDLGD